MLSEARTEALKEAGHWKQSGQPRGSQISERPRGRTLGGEGVAPGAAAATRAAKAMRQMATARIVAREPGANDTLNARAAKFPAGRIPENCVMQTPVTI